MDLNGLFADRSRCSHWRNSYSHTAVRSPIGMLEKLLKGRDSSLCWVAQHAGQGNTKIHGSLGFSRCQSPHCQHPWPGFTEHVGSLLGAEVQAVNGSTFRWFQQQAPYGVCCRSTTASNESKTDEAQGVGGRPSLKVFEGQGT